jgi:hypothetical protein
MPAGDRHAKRYLRDGNMMELAKVSKASYCTHSSSTAEEGVHRSAEAGIGSREIAIEDAELCGPHTMHFMLTKRAKVVLRQRVENCKSLAWAKQGLPIRGVLIKLVIGGNLFMEAGEQPGRVAVQTADQTRDSICVSRTGTCNGLQQPHEPICLKKLGTTDEVLSGTINATAG